jgi:phage tail-like protein
MATLELPSLRVQGVFASALATRLVVINRDPAPGEDAVPLTTTISLELADTRTGGIDRSATKVWIDGEQAFQGGLSPEISSLHAGPRASVSQASDALRIVLDPVVPLASQATVRVRVVSRTVGNTAAIDETYTFTAEDRTSPRLVAAQALGQRRLRLAFDEPMAAADPAGFQFTALDVPAVGIAAVACRVDGRVVEVEVAPEMTADVRYEVVAPGVTDVAGNAAMAPFDRSQFTGFRPPRPPGRRFDLWSMLPKHNRREDVTGDLRRLVACLQDVTDLLLADVDRFEDLFDLERAPEAFVDAMLADLGNPFAFELELLEKRRLVSLLVRSYQQKGTAVGIRNAIRFFMGIEVVAITGIAESGLVLGESLLGVDWELGPSDRFACYAFNVQVDRTLTPIERRRLRSIVDLLRPAHTHFIDLIEPTTPAFIDHWQLALSELGITTILH